MELRLNRFFKKYANTGMWGAGVPDPPGGFPGAFDPLPLHQSEASGRAEPPGKQPGKAGTASQKGRDITLLDTDALAEMLREE